MLAPELQERCCELPRRTGWGPRLIATEVELPHATVHRALKRAGISRPERAPREEVVRYQWPCPGDLLHMDVKRFARFSSPGHAVTGDCHRTGAEKRMRVGYEFAHSIVDDTRAWPTPSCTETSALRLSSPSSNAPWRSSPATGSRRSG